MITHVCFVLYVQNKMSSWWGDDDLQVRRWHLGRREQTHWYPQTASPGLSALSHLALVFLLRSDRRLRGDRPSQSERFYYKKPLLERRPLPQIKHTCTHVSVQSDTQTILTQAHGCTFRRPAQRSTHTHTFSIIFVLCKPNLSTCWASRSKQREERPRSPLQRALLPTHCANPDDIVAMHYSSEWARSCCDWLSHWR